MPKIEDLIRENEELKARLKNCQNWMMRQVAESRLQIEKAKAKISGRHYFVSSFETEVVENIDEMIRTYFGEDLKNAPKFTLERLHDAEIYWNTLQKFSHIDALSIVLSYQKILDAYFEKFTDIFHSKKSMINHTHEYSQIEHDILQVIEKQYTLSLGRWYQLIQSVRQWEDQSPIMRSFIGTIEWQFPHIFRHLTSDEVFLALSELIEGEYFSHKRHTSKVSYIDAKTIREVCVWSYIAQKPSLLLSLFKI